MSQQLAEINLNLNAQAIAVLAALSGMQPDGIARWDDKIKGYDFKSKTTAWYNGRERGFCLAARNYLGTSPCIHICVAECRSGDQIVVYREITEHPFLNHMDLKDESYDTAEYFDYLRIDEVVQYIRQLLRDYFDALAEEIS